MVNEGQPVEGGTLGALSTAGLTGLSQFPAIMVTVVAGIYSRRTRAENRSIDYSGTGRALGRGS